MTEWSDWDAEARAGITCEPGVGLTILDVPCLYTGKAERWLSWDETVALHAWLTQKLAEAERCDTKPTEILNAL